MLTHWKLKGSEVSEELNFLRVQAFKVRTITLETRDGMPIFSKKYNLTL